MKVSKNYSQCYNNFKFDGLKIKNNKEIYGTLRGEIGMILRELCKRKDVEVINAEACPDHIHMYISIPPKHKVYHHLWDT